MNVALLSNNLLQDLEKQLSILSKLSFLEQLDLFGNPVSKEQCYRLRIIGRMPQLKILDRHGIIISNYLTRKASIRKINEKMV